MDKELKIQVIADTKQFHKDMDLVAAKIRKIRGDVQQLGIVGSIFGFFNGRCTFFAILFTTVGISLAFMGKLTAEYVALVGAVQALLVAHSVKEDLNDLRQAQQNTVVNNITVDSKQGA